MNAEQKAAFEKIEQASEKGYVELTAGEYTLSALDHKTRKVFFKFYRKAVMKAEDPMDFFDHEDFDEIEKELHKVWLFKGAKLSSLDTHFEKYPEDYILFTMIGLQVVCYPFLKGSLTS